MDNSKYVSSKNNPGGPEVKKEIIASILEMFFGYGIAIVDIHKKTGISAPTVSKFIGYGLGKIRSEDTIVITLQSKIND